MKIEDKATRTERTQAFEKALAALQAHDRPDDYPGLTKETRRKANLAQFRYFSKSYWPWWRYVHLRMYEQQLQAREDLVTALDAWLPSGDVSPESRVYQEVTNGIIGSVVSELCQYIEDLATLVVALQTDEHFAQRMIECKSGKPRNTIRGWTSPTPEDVCRLFSIPIAEADQSWPSKDAERHYHDGIEYISDRLGELHQVYFEWEYLFHRYKHGLGLALSPFGDALDSEAIEQRRSELSGSPFAFDCSNMPAYIGSDYYEGGFIQVLDGVDSEHVKHNALALSKDRNLLRIVAHPRRYGNDVAVSDLVPVGRVVADLQLVAMFNYHEKYRSPDDSSLQRSFWLPSDEGMRTLTYHDEAPPDSVDSRDTSETM